MLDGELHISDNATAAMVSITSPVFEELNTLSNTERSLRELKELLRTLGIKEVGSYSQNKKDIDPATILGAGKLKEIAEDAKDKGCDLLVFDFELTASQIRNIKKLTGLSVVDRCHVILEIFSKHARTKEARIQIEISRLQYILPRLSGFWAHFGRQRGGVGVKGGEGEQQIELDRRMIRDRITFYKKELKEIEKSRAQQNKKRKNKAITAALVGYTNAGKSSIMNRLCKVDILEENKLFATLDSTYRMLNPDTKPPMILIDTVGFISNLPNTLIDGFKTTLESAMEADLLIVVCDVSDPHFEKHLQVTSEVLEELKIEDKEKIIVFNKKDQVDNQFTMKIKTRGFRDKFFVSSFNPEDMKDLREYVINYFLEKQTPYDLFIPYELGDAHSIVRGKTNIIKTSTHENGIYYKVRIPDFIFNSLGLHNFKLAPNDPFLNQLEA